MKACLQFARLLFQTCLLKFEILNKTLNAEVKVDDFLQILLTSKIDKKIT